MYQGARTLACRYGEQRTGKDGIELVYDLDQKPLLFLDRGLVFPGHILWAHRDGRLTAFQAGAEYFGDARFTKEEIVGVPFRLPFGLVFEAQPEQRGPEVPISGRVRADKPSVIMHEGGVYRMWYETREAGAPGSVKEWTWRSSFATENVNYLRYAESDDGVAWRRPRMDHVLLDGERSNVVYGSLLVPRRGFAGSTVFADPSAEAPERYKMMFSGSMPLEEQREYADRTGNKVDDITLAAEVHGVNVFGVVFGAVSPDGLAWTTLEEPLMLFHTETPESAFYDAEKQCYIAYMRDWHVMQRRSVAKSETRDFRAWPPPRPVLVPRYSDPLWMDFYTNAHTLYPGHEDIHLFFSSVYDRSTDLRDHIALAVSLDGDWFDFVPGPPVISRTAEEWDPDGPAEAGEVTLHSGMVPFGPDHIGVISTFFNVPHKWPRTVAWRILHRWSLWEKDRLVALKAPGRGEFVTAGLELKRPCIFINARTDMSGSIACELLDEMGELVPGFRMDESDPIVGDFQEKLLSWNGKYNLSNMVGKKVYLRFSMSQARLFSISARDIA